ncbi:MAG: SCP2 sterol-binding domain-containing protein [Lachnospiraceae bacterium]|nr:SCP2 sterol-binding domain-containing protein [Lachnospiraceae bacterium]MBO5144728.1 SCP2 sterol-binding domain-containing protein [Lachnospiraceae bacterium]
MKINIYYGGRGLIGDPTLYVLNKIQEVLHELNVNVERYDLYEFKNNIVTLPQTLKDSDGVILATTVEWYGIGGYMQQFLDACWLYGDKERISKTYMCPIVMSTTYGERDAMMSLTEAWEILGGRPVTGICGYVADVSELEQNTGYARVIEKRTEDMYRSINQKIPVFPNSNQAVKQKISFTQSLNLTPQEAEQLSELASDDLYVQKQKEDIQELASMFKDLLNVKEPDNDMFLQALKDHFRPQPGFRAVYKFNISESKKPLIVKVDQAKMECYYGETDSFDVEMQISADIMNEIVQGRMTFQRAFMSGDMKMKGDFKVLRTLDLIYVFL